MQVFYATREDVQRALDSKNTARNADQIDRAIAAATPAIDGLTHRSFAPVLTTRYFDWPNFQYARPWRLWLDSNEVASVSTLVAGGVTISASDYFLRRSDDLDEAPYNHIEIDLDSSAAFSSGSTHQRSIAVTGVFCGCRLDEDPAGSTAEALDSSETGVDVTDSSLIGVGQIIKVDSERMIVTGKSMLDTAQNTTGNQTANNADVTIGVGSGAAFSVGEVILIDAERMLIVDIAANNLIVKRAWDGTVLATHTSPADVYALRTLTVTRGALGTTAATHLTAAPIVKHVIPSLVRSLAVAESLATLLGELSGYASRTGSGESSRDSAGLGLPALREAVYTAHGRKARIGAI